MLSKDWAATQCFLYAILTLCLLYKETSAGFSCRLCVLKVGWVKHFGLMSLWNFLMSFDKDPYHWVLLRLMSDHEYSLVFELTVAVFWEYFDSPAAHGGHPQPIGGCADWDVCNTPSEKKVEIQQFLRQSVYTETALPFELWKTDEKVDNGFPRKSAYPLHYNHIKGTSPIDCWYGL